MWGKTKLCWWSGTSRITTTNAELLKVAGSFMPQVVMRVNRQGQAR